MSEQVPEIGIPFIGIYTTDPDVNNAANYGVVSGTGLTPEEAFNALREAAERWSRSIVQRVWQSHLNASGSFRTKKLQGRKFLVAQASLTAGMLPNGEPGWVAYGTLKGDSRVIEGLL